MPAKVRHSGLVEVLTYDSKEHKASGKLTLGTTGGEHVAEWDANLKSGRVTFKEPPVKGDGKTEYPAHFVEECKKEILSVLGKVTMPFRYHVKVEEDHAKTREEQIEAEKKKGLEKTDKA